MASDASPSPTDCNMNKLSNIVVQTLSYYACMEVAYLKCPHPTIIDEDMRWDNGWFLGGFGVVGHPIHNQLGGS
jgi:hypothetical protein